MEFKNNVVIRVKTLGDHCILGALFNLGYDSEEMYHKIAKLSIYAEESWRKALVSNTVFLSGLPITSFELFVHRFVD